MPATPELQNFVTYHIAVKAAAGNVIIRFVRYLILLTLGVLSINLFCQIKVKGNYTYCGEGIGAPESFNFNSCHYILPDSDKLWAISYHDTTGFEFELNVVPESIHLEF